MYCLLFGESLTSELNQRVVELIFASPYPDFHNIYFFWGVPIIPFARVSTIEGNFFENENHEGRRDECLIGYSMHSFPKLFVSLFCHCYSSTRTVISKKVVKTLLFPHERQWSCVPLFSKLLAMFRSINTTALDTRCKSFAWYFSERGELLKAEDFTREEL